MKLYLDPISTTSRPLLMFAEEHALPVEIVHVRLFEGEHRTPDFLRINPNGCVPVLVDGGFVLTESGAILRYLADLAGSPAYPTDLRARARINAAMDWFATNFHTAVGTQLAYPALFPAFHPFSPEARAEVAATGLASAHRWLVVLDQHMLGPRRNYVAGEELTIADYVGGSMLALAEAAEVDLGDTPNVRRWLATLKGRPSWDPTFAAFNGLLSATRPAA
ncbi:glutathione S-transferase family protein [Sphingomonas swuensis]|uniref:Glutathione S-transferase family protein n=1 Tax=Sphingomonas swuensis TaxID=977800 RepID=A0ABP7SKE6_9SPHN